MDSSSLPILWIHVMLIGLCDEIMRPYILELDSAFESFYGFTFPPPSLSVSILDVFFACFGLLHIGLLVSIGNLM
ncbi:hypothetical protein VNO78_28709 [Psophocarpus tetragonolobus]|uniref:Uncharacterized protein n=1 Tax=Psophocarpus tetragonolobus TaxID=3891 RepID=A0AAN9RTN5_PSOTE